ncbi:MAG TPA: CapA family protein [Candidatus Acidoferrum sp.]|nr:CapA family protein [Candidatus Acidoferrum sp.]
MKRVLMLTGDVNLMNVADPEVPFARVTDTLRQADVLFGNLECCFYEPAGEHALEREGFYAPLASARALVVGGFHAIGNANNVNYGEEAIRSSLARLDALGVAHTGAGVDRRAARAPAIVTHAGLRFGFVQRTSVYWATGHEATDSAPGVAVLTGHTAYQPPLQTRLAGGPPANRPGIPAVTHTWADAASLAEFAGDLRALRAAADVVVASHHWGLSEDVLVYQVEIAHAAIDAGADVVMGHGPHYACAVEMYRGKPIFYGLGSFSFHTGHGGRAHGDWVGLLARVTFDDSTISEVAFSLVRHDERNHTYVCDPSLDKDALEQVTRRCDKLGATLTISGNELVVWTR